MKILLTGHQGQLGFELCRSLAPMGEVISVGHRECDLADESAIRDLVRRVAPDVIVNPAAYTAVDAAETEPALAYAINARAPGIFGEEAVTLGALVVHYSTDYVFDGTKEGFYQESDRPNPQSVYGASKLAGEHALQASGARCFIFRTSWVVGAYGSNFAKTILRLAQQRETLCVVADQFGAPTSAALLADVTAHVIGYASDARQRQVPYGLYHLVADGVTNWHAYACYIVERARAAGLPIMVPREAIEPLAARDRPSCAKRPANSRLDTRKFRHTFGLTLPNWRQGVDHIMDQLLQNLT